MTDSSCAQAQTAAVKHVSTLLQTEVMRTAQASRSAALIKKLQINFVNNNKNKCLLIITYITSRHFDETDIPGAGKLRGFFLVQNAKLSKNTCFLMAFFGQRV